jgi:hypothetical protein
MQCSRPPTRRLIEALGTILASSKLSPNVILWLSFLPIIIAFMFFVFIRDVAPNALCEVIEREMGCSWRPWAVYLRNIFFVFPWLMVASCFFISSVKNINRNGWVALALLALLYVCVYLGIALLNRSH